LKPLYEGGAYKHRIGYVISGTDKDGIYLEVQDENDETPYFLNTPRGRSPSHCDATPLSADCKRLPFLRAGSSPTETERTFTPRAGATATVLKDPLWFAAKWGAFRDFNGNDQPDLAGEWDENGDGIPDAYLPVQNPLKLRDALRKTLDNIVARSSSASSLTSNSTRATGSTRLYQAVFDTQRWSGDLLAWRITGSGLASTPDWQASQQLPAWQSRKIFLHTTDRGVQPFAQSGLPGAPPELVNYLRGDRSPEIRQGGGLRDRNNPLGDIAHASPLHDPDTDTVYVNANDGMLHAFNGSDGKELFAFIPQAVGGRIAQQASVTYDHQYLLDGELARAPRGPLTQNRRYLYALLGRGGKGLFSLNVTEPTQFGTSDWLWDYSGGASSPGATDRDLGLMLGRPVVTALNNGKLGVIVGNGYNSDSGKAVLYIFIIQTDGRLESVRKIDTQIGGNNGLAGPAILDTNQDGKADVVYAGDLLGNVWRFDIGATDPAQWGLSLNNSPLFRARDAAGKAQPITAPIFVAVNDRSNNGHLGKPYVFFGTGAYFRQDDPPDRSVQSWYGLVDDGTAIASGRAALRQRTITDTRVLAGVRSRTFSTAAEGDLQGLRGWYLDLGGAAAGERTVTVAQIARLAVPALVVSSLVPVTDDPCVAGGRGFVNTLDPFNGGALTVGVIDVNGDGDFSNDKLGDRLVGSVDRGVGLPSQVIFLSRPNRTTTAFVSGSGGTDPQSLTAGAGIGGLTLKSATQGGRRIVWREIIKD
jgi:type IV pilus assembly protein PilY1